MVQKNSQVNSLLRCVIKSPIGSLSSNTLAQVKYDMLPLFTQIHAEYVHVLAKERACAVFKNLHACVTVALMTVRWNADMYLLEVEMSYHQLYWVSPWCIWYVCIVLPITMGVVGCMLPGYYGCHFYDT